MLSSFYVLKHQYFYTSKYIMLIFMLSLKNSFTSIVFVIVCLKIVKICEAFKQLEIVSFMFSIDIYFLFYIINVLNIHRA
jgi:hypothetical protein